MAHRRRCRECEVPPAPLSSAFRGSSRKSSRACQAKAKHHDGWRGRRTYPCTGSRRASQPWRRSRDLMRLMPRHGARLAAASRSGSDHKVTGALCDGRNEVRKLFRKIASIAIHIEDDAGSLACGEAPARHVRPYPLPALSTRAPFAFAISIVRSLDPPSATMISSTASRGIRSMTPPIDASSSSTGMTTHTPVSLVSRTGAEVLSTTSAISQAPTKAASRAGQRRPFAREGLAKTLVLRAIPNLSKRRGPRVAQREILITAHREGRDAAGKRAAMRGEVHQRPGPSAERPWRIAVEAAKAKLRLRGAGGVEKYPKLSRQFFGIQKVFPFFAIALLKERGSGRARPNRPLSK